MVKKFFVLILVFLFLSLICAIPLINSDFSLNESENISEYIPLSENYSLQNYEIYDLSPLINLEILFPTADINATQNYTFNVSVNVSCSVADCGEINVSLDPLYGMGSKNYSVYNSSESSDYAFAWEDILLNVDLKEINKTELVDVEIIYQITDGKNLIWEEKETLAIINQTSFLKRIVRPNFPTGNYEIKVIVNYGKNQTASSSKQFEVLNKNNIFIYGVVFLFLILLGFISYNWYLIRKEQKKIKDYIKNFMSSIKEKKFHEISSPVLVVPRKKPITINSEEIAVLTLLEGIKKEDGINFIKKYLGYSDEKTQELIKNLVDKRLLKIILSTENGEESEWCFHTKNVKDFMINDKLRFERNLGWDYSEVLENSEKN